jgi:hypothetical protein
MPRSRRIDPDEISDETEEEAAEVTPRRRRKSAVAEEEAKPVRRKRPPAEEPEDEYGEEEPPRPRKRPKPKDEDDEYEDETGDEDSDDEPAVIPVSRGRSAIKKNRPVSEASLAYFRFTEETQLVKFLTTEPWAYDQHWIKREGKMSFPCIGKGCPLCHIGVKVSQKIIYPVLNLTPPKGDDFIVQSMEVGTQNDEVLAGLDADAKTGPLMRLWWSVSRTEMAKSGGRKKYSYSFIPVKDRDLEEDWEIDLDDAEDAVADAKIPSTKEVLGEWNRAKLQEIADEVMGTH